MVDVHHADWAHTGTTRDDVLENQSRAVHAFHDLLDEYSTGTRDVATEVPSPRAPWPSAALEISRGPDRGKRYVLADDTLVVGRHRACDIVLDDPTVATRHATFRHDAGAVMVADQGTLNGTYLNGRPVMDQAALVDGDELMIGKFRLVFRARASQ